jgi:hypothetical protein
MKPHYGRACFGGFVATIVVTFMVYFVSPNMTGGPSDLAAMMVSLLGVSWIAAIAMYVVIGAVVFPVFYERFLNGRLPGGPALRGTTWGLILWLVSQALVVPVTGGGVFSSADGGLRMVIESLFGHLVYGLVFGVWVGGPRSSPSARKATFRAQSEARQAG